MAENLKEIDAIAKNPAKPDFENAIAAVDLVGGGLEVREQQVMVHALRVRDDILRRQVEERIADLLRRRGRVPL